MKKEYEAPDVRALRWNTQETLTTNFDGEGEDFPIGSMSEMIEEW